jgi:2-polyprenyl-3-methyl-5-hydroxy-6-metoxy-1,4-benzoquinol methylase
MTSALAFGRGLFLLEGNMRMDAGERQIATHLSQVRADHTARYEWAAKQIAPCTLMDIGAGIGYGTAILKGHGFKVLSIEIDQEAIEWGGNYFGAEYERRDLSSPDCFYALGRFGAAICFECIEHLKDPTVMLSRIPANILFGSVPNEAVFPWQHSFIYHHRHYHAHEVVDTLHESGWEVSEMMGQRDDVSPVDPNVDGRTSVFRAVRRSPKKPSRAPAGQIVRV